MTRAEKKCFKFCELTTCEVGIMTDWKLSVFHVEVVAIIMLKKSDLLQGRSKRVGRSRKARELP